MRRLQGRDQGPLSLAAPFTTLYHLLPETLLAYLQAYPQVELTLLDRDQACVFALVKAGDIDFGLALESLVPRDLTAWRWQPVDTVLLVPLGHPLARVRRVTWRQIADYPLIVPPRGHESGGRRLLEEQFRKLGLAFRIILESSNVELSARYVETGLGLAFATLARGLPCGRRSIWPLCPWVTTSSRTTWPWSCAGTRRSPLISRPLLISCLGIQCFPSSSLHSRVLNG